MKITHSTVVSIPDDPPAGGVGETAWNDDHTIEGLGLQAYAEYSANGTTSGTEQVINCTGASPFSLILTSPALDADTSWSLKIKNTGAGTVTLLANIDNLSSWNLAQYSSITLVFNGTIWMAF
jgi:hypothetical protein